MHRATISLAIDLALLQAAEEAAKQEGITRSAMIRRCVRETLERDQDIEAEAEKDGAK